MLPATTSTAAFVARALASERPRFRVTILASDLGRNRINGQENLLQKAILDTDLAGNQSPSTLNSTLNLDLYFESAWWHNLL